MTLDDFIKKYDGKVVDFDGKYGGQCVDLYRQYVQEVLGFPQSPPVDGAKDIWDTYLKDYFVRITNTPEGIPTKGDVVIWGSGAGTYGHVAIFIEGTAGSFKSFDQNWPTGSNCHVQGHYYSNVLGWLHPTKEEDMTDQQKAALEALQQAVDKGLYGNVESAARAVVDLANDVKRMDKEIAGLNEKVVGLNDKIETISNSLTDTQEQLRIAESDIGKKNLQITELEKIIDSYQSLPSSANDLTVKELLKLLINKLLKK